MLTKQTLALEEGPLRLLAAAVLPHTHKGTVTQGALSHLQSATSPLENPQNPGHVGSSLEKSQPIASDFQ